MSLSLSFSLFLINLVLFFNFLNTFFYHSYSFYLLSLFSFLSSPLIIINIQFSFIFSSVAIADGFCVYANPVNLLASAHQHSTAVSSHKVFTPTIWRPPLSPTSPLPPFCSLPLSFLPSSVSPLYLYAPLLPHLVSPLFVFSLSSFRFAVLSVILTFQCDHTHHQNLFFLAHSNR